MRELDFYEPSPACTSSFRRLANGRVWYEKLLGIIGWTYYYRKYDAEEVIGQALEDALTGTLAAIVATRESALASRSSVSMRAGGITYDFDAYVLTSAGEQVLVNAVVERLPGRVGGEPGASGLAKQIVADFMHALGEWFYLPIHGGMVWLRDGRLTFGVHNR